MRLSHRDFDLLQRSILNLHEDRTAAEFRQAIPDIFLTVIPADHFSLACYRIDLETGAAQMVDAVESDKRFNSEFVRSAEKLLIVHPFTRYFMSGGAMSAVKFSDFFTSAQLYRTVWREVVVRTLGYDRAISVPVENSNGIAAISLGRPRRDFTERDRMMLNLLRPHFNQAQRNAERRSAKTPQRGARAGLTRRESEVGCWLAEGKTNSEIATILGISSRTVEKHMERIFEKLSVENRATAALMLVDARSL